MNKRTMFDENIPVETRLDMLKGASLPVKAWRRVLVRSSNDRETRLIVMLGYFFWNWSLSVLICFS